MICPLCKATFDNRHDATVHSLTHDPMPATYSVVISGFLDEDVATALADQFEHAPNKPTTLMVRVDRIWWP